MVEQTLKLALELGRPVKIFYSASGKQTVRTIEVLELRAGSVKAYCHMRRGNRVFKLEGILSAKLAEDVEFMRGE